MQTVSVIFAIAVTVVWFIITLVVFLFGIANLIGMAVEWKSSDWGDRIANLILGLLLTAVGTAIGLGPFVVAHN